MGGAHNGIRIADEEVLTEMLAKLPAADFERYHYDLLVYGHAMVRQLDDGSFVYMPAKEWLADHFDEKDL